MESQDFGKAVRAARLKMGLTPAELARRAGMDRTAWYAIEKGVCPSVARADKVLKVMGMTLRIGSQTGRKRLDL